MPVNLPGQLQNYVVYCGSFLEPTFLQATGKIVFVYLIFFQFSAVHAKDVLENVEWNFMSSILLINKPSKNGSSVVVYY